MTPKEKSKELVDKFKNYCDVDDPNGILDWQDCLKQNAKNCALIAVDEIINSNPCFEDLDRGGNLMYNNNTYYWQEVKEEINKL